MINIENGLASSGDCDLLCSTLSRQWPAWSRSPGRRCSRPHTHGTTRIRCPLTPVLHIYVSCMAAALNFLLASGQIAGYARTPAILNWDSEFSSEQVPTNFQVFS